MIKITGSYNCRGLTSIRVIDLILDFHVCYACAGGQEAPLGDAYTKAPHVECIMGPVTVMDRLSALRNTRA